MSSKADINDDNNTALALSVSAVSDASPTESPDHLYDDPHLHGKEFLLAVMRDLYTSLAVRIDAACKLLDLDPFGWDYVFSDIRIVVPPLPDVEGHA